MYAVKVVRLRSLQPSLFGCMTCSTAIGRRNSKPGTTRMMMSIVGHDGRTDGEVRMVENVQGYKHLIFR